MSRFLLLLAAALLAGSSGALRAQTAPAATPPTSAAWTDHRRVLPDKLRQLPEGLTLWHSNNPSYPEPDPAQPGQYVWKHDTAVRAEKADLQVVECGSFIWYSEAGWQANRLMNPAEFAAAFNCPGGRLRKGRPYTFANNNRHASNARQLYGGDALWYILAKDANGKLFRGLGLLETEATPLGPPPASPAP